MWNLMNWTNEENRNKLIDREQADSWKKTVGVRGRRAWAKKKKRKFMDRENNSIVIGGEGANGGGRVYG